MIDPKHRTATILRPPKATYDDEGTFDRFIADTGWSCDFMELPDRNNEPDLSLVDEGTFRMVFRKTQRHPEGIYIMAEPDDGRTAVEWHGANVAGDIKKGFASQLHGCGAPGASVETFKKGTRLGDIVLTRDQRGVAASGPTLQALERQYRNADGTQADVWVTIKRQSALEMEFG